MDETVITGDELKSLIKSKVGYILIDVREPDELKHGMIPTAKHIPLGEIDKALDMSEIDFKEKYGFNISKKDNLIFYCRTGSRSGVAAVKALNQGFKARNYKGSIWEWSETDPNVKRYD